MTENSLIRLWRLEGDLADEERTLPIMAADEREFYRTKQKIDTITDRIVALRTSVGSQS